MRQFDKNKALQKLNIKHNRSTYIKRISIVLSCIILIVGIILFTFAKFESNQEYVLIKGLVKEATKDVNIIAVYQGSNKVDEIPAKGNGWYFDRAVCTNGATTIWDNEEWGLLVKASQKTRCTLYFKQGTNAVTYINNLDKSANALIADGTADNNLRYTGANPNNYVSFNNELWRIIGVMNNIQTSGGQTQSLLKIRRAEALGTYVFDSSASGINVGSGINQWGQTNDYEGSDLMRELNTDYLGSVYIGYDGKWYSSTNNVRAGNKPSSTISYSSQNMIERVVWPLGAPNNDNGTIVNYEGDTLKAPYVYTHERANTTGKLCSSGNYCNDGVVRTSTWTGLIGLIYPTDYLYATSGGSTTSRATCLNTKQYGWNDSSIADCKDNSWIHNSTEAQWTMLPRVEANHANYMCRVHASGVVGTGTTDSPSLVYPTIFLKSSIAIIGGSGTSSDPYILG